MSSKLNNKRKSLERLSALEETNLNSIVNEFAQVTSVISRLDEKIILLNLSIYSAEDKLREQHSYGHPLKLGSMNTLMAYIKEQRELLEPQKNQKKRAQELADNINKQLKKTKNKLKILKEKHAEVINEIAREKDKSRSKELDDMWLQRKYR